VRLQNTVAPDPFGDPVDPKLVRDIMEFRVGPGAVSDPSTVPATLADPNDLPALPPRNAPTTRRFLFDDSGDGGVIWTINGLPFDNTRIDATPTNISSEIWEFINDSGDWLHTIHPHLVQYRVLSRNGKAPRPYEVGLKDTVSLGPDEVIRVWISPAPNASPSNPSGFQLPPRFGSQPPPSNPARFVFHCHNIEHEDDDMMTRYAVQF
jgi:spore coat protein A